MTDSTPSAPHPVPPTARLRRTSSLSLMDGGSSLLGSFAHKFQSKRTAGALPAPPAPALSASHHSHSHSHSHSHRRKPMVIYYSSAAAAGPPSSPSPSVREDRGSGRSTDGDEDEAVRSSRRLSRAHTLDELDGFDVESAMANYAASFGPRAPSASTGPVSSSAAPPSASRRSSTLRRMSMRFSHGMRTRDPAAPPSSSSSSSSARPTVSAAGRAEARARKYDVDWRDDRAAACCQLCFSVFTTLSRRRHHCRLCGELVCGSCSPDQVALVDKFAGPKRACNACFSLLETLAAAKDPRVLRVDGAQHRYPVPSSASGPIPSEAASSSATADADEGPALTADAPSTPSGSALLLIAPPTPRYRDRLAEVRRVMAAGEKSKRRGSNGRAGIMCVVPSAWVRQWLAFTESSAKDEAAPTSSSSTPSSPDYEPRPTTRSTGSSTPSPTSVVPAPGPINNWQLLEFAQGRLVQRPDVTRDDGPTGSADGSAAPQGFQLITTEVYEVFQRLYGGGPTIRVDMETSKQWMVDIGPVLAALPIAKVSPAVERALLQRHAVRSESDAALSSSSTAMVSPVVARAQLPTPDSKHGSPTASSSGATVLSDDDGAASMVAALEPALSVTTVKTEAVASPSDEVTSSSSSVVMRSPSAATATAASAFALAMKQARLNAQRAIDERARVA